MKVPGNADEIRRYLVDVEKKICPRCAAPIEFTRHVPKENAPGMTHSSHVFAFPCGHHLWIEGTDLEVIAGNQSSKEVLN